MKTLFLARYNMFDLIGITTVAVLLNISYWFLLLCIPCSVISVIFERKANGE